MNDEATILQMLKASVRGRVVERYPLSSHTSYKIGGIADIAIFPQDLIDLGSALQCIHRTRLPLTVIGGGSNVLISDLGIRGAVILMGELTHLEIRGCRLSAESGMSSHQVALSAQSAALSGAEFLTCLPGSIGGACVMNARAYNGEMSQIARSATVFEPDGIFHTIPLRSDSFSYKRSVFQTSGQVIGQLTLELHPGDPATIQAQMDCIAKERANRHEPDFPSCGCVFKNDHRRGVPSGKLIESLGLKGFRIGDAEVSPYHANFIINRGQATAAQVREVIAHVQRQVSNQTGYPLELEVRLLGEWPD